MKFKALTLVFLLTTIFAFGQKREIKNAEKALEKGKIADAKSMLNKVESQIPSERDKIKARFYTAKGMVYLAENNQQATTKGLKIAAESFQKAVKYGNDKDGKKGLNETKRIMVNSAVADQKAKDFDQASKKLYQAYQMSPQDTLYLFAAANNAFNAQDNQKAIKLYKKLKDMGYQGNALQYIATDKSTGKTRVFANKDQRDLFIKSGKYKDPGVRRAESKTGDIVKQLALLYLRNDQKDKAMEAIKEAKKENPNDLQMLKAEASIYQQLGESEKFTALLKQLVEKDPDNAGVYYKLLGDGLLKNKKPDEAKKYYKKAVKADPKMADAYNGIAGVILQQQEDVVNEMNDLGMSDADSKKYDKLSEKRDSLLKEALPYMEKALKNDPDNVDMMRTLYQLNVQLRNKEEAKKYKSMMEKAGKGNR